MPQPAPCWGISYWKRCRCERLCAPDSQSKARWFVYPGTSIGLISGEMPLKDVGGGNLA